LSAHPAHGGRNRLAGLELETRRAFDFPDGFDAEDAGERDAR
jgi:hypothetical protein